MTRVRLLSVLLLALAVLLAAGCGGGGGGADESSQSSENVPKDAVAVVAGTPISRAAFDRFFVQAEAAYKAQGQEFPKAGSPEYADLQRQAIDFLVQRTELAKEAETLGIEVTDAEVQERLEELKTQFFEDEEKVYQDALEERGLTEADVLADTRSQLISEKIFEQITGDETVTGDEVRAYYDENAAEFTTAESRQVAHILVDKKTVADDLYQQLQDGADFAALAKKHSTDTASAADGGVLTDERGSFVPEFEEVAFALDTGEIGKPVQSQFGWHVIKALADTVPKKEQPFDEVRDSLQKQLLEEKKNEVMTAWVEDVRSKYANQIAYAVGFAPPAGSTNANQ